MAERGIIDKVQRIIPVGCALVLGLKTATEAYVPYVYANFDNCVAEILPGSDNLTASGFDENGNPVQANINNVAQISEYYYLEREEDLGPLKRECSVIGSTEFRDTQTFMRIDLPNGETYYLDNNQGKWVF